MTPTTNDALTTATVTMRYWAGAAAAAGVTSETLTADTVGAALDEAIARHPGLERVVAVCVCLLDGGRVDRDTDLPPGATLEVLPPFAGG